jgi:nucleoside-diphosphate-sugar epimerase
MMHATLTGAGGWFGSALLTLLETGECTLPPAQWTIVLGIQDTPGLDARWSRYGNVERGSLLDDEFTAALPQADLLIHAAAVIHPPDTRPTATRPTTSFPPFVQNVEMCAAVLRRCAPSAKVVLLSSAAALGVGVLTDATTRDAPGLLGYAASKRSCELLVETFCATNAASAAMVRAFWFYGPSAPERQGRFDRLAVRGWFPLVQRGRHPRSTSRVDDVARAVLAAVPLTTPSCPAFFVADAQTRSMREICDLRRPAGVRHKAFLPQWFASLVRWCDGWVQRRGGYVQNLHVLAELADPIAIPAELATNHRSRLGLALVDQHVDGVRAERATRG